jgi:hypothetical protein
LVLIEIVLKDHRGSRGIETALPLFPILLSERQPLFRLAARKPLVLQDDGDGDS